MGFGILIFGYMLLINVPYRGIDFPPDVLGFGLMLIALWKLGAYEKKFKAGAAVTVLLVVTSGLRLWSQIAASFSFPWNTPPELPLALAEMGLLFFFYLLVLSGIASLAKSVDLPNLAWKAKRNLCLVLLFYAFTVYTNLYLDGSVPEIQGVTVAGIYGLQQLAGYALRFLNLVLFVSCYMRICLEGDEDMNYEPNAFERKMEELRKSWSRKE